MFEVAFKQAALKPSCRKLDCWRAGKTTFSTDYVHPFSISVLSDSNNFKAMLSHGILKHDSGTGAKRQCLKLEICNKYGPRRGNHKRNHHGFGPSKRHGLHSSSWHQPMGTQAWRASSSTLHLQAPTVGPASRRVFPHFCPPKSGDICE